MVPESKAHRNVKKGKSQIYADTPVKKQLEEEASKKRKKENPVSKKKLSKQFRKTKLSADKVSSSEDGDNVTIAVNVRMKTILQLETLFLTI